MDNYIEIGKVVGTHGIKGELKILSNFQYKDKIFIIGNKLFIKDKEYTINSHRHHKKFELVTLNDYNNINDVLYLVGYDVYLDKNNLLLNDNEILDSDLIKYKVLDNNGNTGYIKEIFMASPTNKIIRVVLDREVLVPYNPNFIKIDNNKKIVYINMIEGM